MTGRQPPPGPRPILLGTGNADKQDSLRRLVEDLPLLPTQPLPPDLKAAPEETGGTHEAIAGTKAIYWSQVASTLAVASDGGLLLPALGMNWESRYTSRFAGPSANNAQRLECLLELMLPYHGDQRAASWVEAVAVADRGRLLASWQVTGAAGVIADRVAGVPPDSGFWVFSVWYFPRFGKTYDQLSPDERAGVGDHWAQLREPVQTFFRSYLERVS